MIIIPEIETVVILVPRTGSGSLRRAIAAEYPKSMMIYRHMEADGIPHGYDRWNRLGVVRDPLDRLWSLYKFMKQFSGDYDDAYIAQMQQSTKLPFNEWVMFNQTVFTSPYDSAGRGRFWPVYTVNHPIPENQKSQFMYLRPDLGTEVWRFDEMSKVYDRLRLHYLSTKWENQTRLAPFPKLMPETRLHMERVFKWDYEVTQVRRIRGDMPIAPPTYPKGPPPNPSTK